MTFELILILMGLCTLAFHPCPKDGDPQSLAVLFPTGTDALGNSHEHATELWVEQGDWVSGTPDDVRSTPDKTYYVWNVTGGIKVKVDSEPLTLNKIVGNSIKSVMNLGEAKDTQSDLGIIKTEFLPTVDNIPKSTVVRAYLSFDLKDDPKSGTLLADSLHVRSCKFLSKDRRSVSEMATITRTDADRVEIILDRNNEKFSIGLQDDHFYPNQMIHAYLINTASHSTEYLPNELGHFRYYYPLSSADDKLSDGERGYRISCEPAKREGKHSAHGRGKDGSHLVKPVACAICQGCG